MSGVTSAKWLIPRHCGGVGRSVTSAPPRLVWSPTVPTRALCDQVDRLDVKIPAMPKLTFDGRVAVVTGAGRGIARSHALELGRRGAAVVVNDVGRAADGAAPAYRADTVAEEIIGA